MRKILSVLCVMVVVSTAAFAQEGEKKNTISFGPNMSGEYPIYPGFTLEYERALNASFSAAVHGGTEMGIPYLELHGRWYPWKAGFFADIGIGLWGIFSIDVESTLSVFMVSPGIGWKIDAGKPGGWYVTPGVFAHLFPLGGFNVVIPKINLYFGYSF